MNGYGVANVVSDVNNVMPEANAPSLTPAPAHVMVCSIVGSVCTDISG